jgi:hypothetical protein
LISLVNSKVALKRRPATTESANETPRDWFVKIAVGPHRNALSPLELEADSQIATRRARSCHPLGCGTDATARLVWAEHDSSHVDAANTPDGAGSSVGDLRLRISGA